MIVHASFCCDQVSDCLNVLARYYRVVDHEVVQSFTGVLEVELNALNAVSEEIEWHLDSLSNGNKLLLLFVNAVTCEQGKWTQVSLQSFLVLKVDWAESTDLHVEELPCVKHRLLLLTRHLIEQICVVWMLHKVQPAVRVFISRHVSKHFALILFSTDPGCQRVAHHEDREVLVQLECLVLGVGHADDKGRLVFLISYCGLRVSRQIDAVQLVEHLDKLVA